MTNYIYANDYHPEAGKLEPGQFSARGNYGELICDLATGKVVKYLADTDADEEQNYEDVEALDLAEFEKENGHKVEDQGFYDVLDFDAIIKAGATA
jgi:hypothetical protein